MSFGAPQWFWGLLAIPILVGLFVRAEQRAGRRLQEFVSPRLLPQLAGTVNRFRRALRFAFLLLGLALAIASLAQPRWGYIYEDVKRKGLDLLIAVDTSRSMLSNDVQPNRLERVKLATQDLIDELQGDRVGLIAFAGRAFVQAPLTIDYDATVESINDLDTKTIPEGGTNISEAIARRKHIWKECNRKPRADHFHRWRGTERRRSESREDGSRCRHPNLHRGRRHAARLVDSGTRRGWRHFVRQRFEWASCEIEAGRQTVA